MPVHDWTRVNAGVFHDFHYSWVLEIKRVLKRDLLPPEYYVMAEQVGGDVGTPDVLTLQTSDSPQEQNGPLTGTSTLTESPPITQARATIQLDTYARRQRTLVVRHTSNDRIVAMLEVLSPGNKSSRHAMRTLLDKAVAAMYSGIHLLLIDVHPPSPRDPHGIHGAMMAEIGTEEYLLENDQLRTAVASIGGPVVEALVNHFCIDDPLPEMPLFLTCENYVRVPLEQTYLAAWEDVPQRYQQQLQAP